MKQPRKKTWKKTQALKIKKTQKMWEFVGFFHDGPNEST